MAAAARSKAAFDGGASGTVLPSPAAASMAAAAAAAARSYLPSPYLPNFPPPYRHPLLPFASAAAAAGGYNPAAASFHSLLAGLARPKLDEYQNLLNAAAAAGQLPPPPPPPPVSTPPATSTASSASPPGCKTSNPPSPTAKPDHPEDRKTESINSLRMKAREHEAKLEEKND